MPLEIADRGLAGRSDVLAVVENIDISLQQLYCHANEMSQNVASVERLSEGRLYEVGLTVAYSLQW